MFDDKSLTLLFDTVKSPSQARDQLEFLSTKLDCCLVIDGESLQVSSYSTFLTRVSLIIFPLTALY